MAFVYRYWDITNGKADVVYIGKVTRKREEAIEGLVERHREHKNDLWYRDIGDDNLVLEWFEIDSDADADILESWYISKLDGPKLNNRAKRWGPSGIEVKCNHSRWQTLRSYYEQSYVKSTRTLVDMVLDDCDKKVSKYDAVYVSRRMSNITLECLGELDKIKRFEQIVKNNINIMTSYMFMM